MKYFSVGSKHWRGLVFDFLDTTVSIPRSDDFRGVMFIPETSRHDVVRKQDVIAAVGYCSFIGKTCNIHVSVQKPEMVTRQMIREAFEFPFQRCGIEQLIGIVDANNESALNFDLRLGFREVLRFPEAAKSGKDLIILTMAKKDCRWLKKEQQ